MWMPQKASLSVPVGREGVEETGSHQQGAFPTACPMFSVPRAKPGTERNGGLEPWGSALTSVRVLGLSSLGSSGTCIPRQPYCISRGPVSPVNPTAFRERQLQPEGHSPQVKSTGCWRGALRRPRAWALPWGTKCTWTSVSEPELGGVSPGCTRCPSGPTAAHPGELGPS